MAATAIDSKPETGWGVDPQEGKPHAAIFVLNEPLRRPGRTRLTVVLEQQLGRGHLIGRPRISVTTFVPADRPRRLPTAWPRSGDCAGPADAAAKVGPRAALHDWQIGRDWRRLPPAPVYAAATISHRTATFIRRSSRGRFLFCAAATSTSRCGRPHRGAGVRAGPRVPLQAGRSR